MAIGNMLRKTGKLLGVTKNSKQNLVEKMLTNKKYWHNFNFALPSQLSRFCLLSGLELEYLCDVQLIFCFFTIYVASPEAQRRNSLEKQLEKLDNDMSLLSKISILADTLTITHMVIIWLFRNRYSDLIFKLLSVNLFWCKCCCERFK